MAVNGPSPIERIHQELWSAEDLVAGNAAETRAYRVVERGGVVAVVPESRRAAATAARRWTDATSPVEVATRLAWSSVTRLGLGRRLGSRLQVRVERGAESLHEFLVEVLGVADLELSILLGSYRPNRKPIVQIHARDGSTLAFAKVAWNAPTRAMVDNEATVLAGLDPTQLRGIRIPRVLHHGAWRDRTVLVTTPVPVSAPIRRPGAPGPDILRVVADLDGSFDAPLGESVYWSSVRERITGLDTSTQVELETRCAAVAQRSADRPLRFGRWHGDWTPWNMRRTGHELSVWDWERSGAPVPVGFDALHYELHALLHRGTHEPAAAIGVAAQRVRPTLEGLGVTDPAGLTALYAIEMRLRFADTELPWVAPVLRAATETLI